MGVVMRKSGMARWFAGSVMAVSVLAVSQGAHAAPPPGTNSVDAEAAACAALYGVGADIGPDASSVCQWDMRAIGATSAGSYAVNRGRGARIGDIDTGIDLTNGDIMPNVDVAASCVFLYADTPTAGPSEQVTRGDCSNKAALQDLAGHGTHTAGTIAAPINGHRRVRSRAGGDGRRAQGRDRSRATSSPSRSSMRSGTRAISISTLST